MEKNKINQSEINERKPFRFLDTITALFVAVLIISNIASTKIVEFFGLTFFGVRLAFDGGTLLFPLSYIFGDILTEVYGYKRSRKVIWTGFFCLILMSLIFYLVQIMPPAQGWENQIAFETILGMMPRLVVASLIAYLAGEFSNSFILAKMKILTKGKHLWQRTIGSTLVGEGIDSIIFCMIAFYGVLPNDLLIAVIVSNYVIKVGIEILFTPLTYKIVGFLKKKEHEDYYDFKTNFNPFKMN